MRLRVGLIAAVLALILCGSCFAGSTMYSWAGGEQFRQCAFSQAAYTKHTTAVVFSAKTPVREGEEAGVGVLETPEVVTAKPFAEAIPSWNAITPDGAYVVVLMKLRVDGKWSKWVKLDLWNVAAKPELKHSYEDSDDLAFAEISAIGVKGKIRADAFRMRLELRSTDGKTYPTLRYIAVNTNDPTPAGWTESTEPVKSVWGTELDVPYLCQLSVKGGSIWCSPTSTAMVLGYWGKLMNRPDFTVGITDAALGIKDNRWGGTGHWGFNVAYAGEFKGIRAHVDRFSSVSRIEDCIAKGVPVIVSLDYAKLNRWKGVGTVGHLMVIRGFTKEGDPVFNDPWAKLEKGEKLRKVFKRADLEYAWLGPNGSQGTVYILRPEKLKL